MFELMQSINHCWGLSFCNNMILFYFLEQFRGIYYRLVILTNWVFYQHCTYCQQWCIYVHMKLQLPISRYWNWYFHVLSLDLIPSLFTFYGPDKGFYFPHQLNDQCHDEGKVIYETFIKLNHTIKNLNLLWIDKYWHIHYCLKLLRVWYFSFLRNYEP